MIGTRLQDRYQLTAEIGRGAMGVVYRARDELLARDVAVKLVPASRLDAVGRGRFLREARTAGALHHPGIVTLYDAGETEDAAYLVMELVEGRSLRELEPPTLGEALEVARQLCGALAHAHERGVVHRDLKPENVLIAEPSGVRQVKLADFGLASAQGATRLTGEGAVIGTLAYLAPEQALAQPTDARADLYSLGILLYELVTGATPFPNGSPQVMLSQHLRAIPASPRASNPGIPEALDALILQLLAKEPAQRPADAGAVLAALERIAAESADSQPLPRGSRERRAVPELIGRGEEIERVRAWLLRDGARLITLTGAGGAGKTRLVEWLTADLDSYFDAGAIFVPLAAVSDPALVPATIARALAAREPGPGELGAVAREVLGARTALIVLDNFEQVLAAAPAVSALLEACEGARVIVTSRERLRLEHEREFEVPPLALPDPAQSLTAQRLAIVPAVELFVRRARAAQHDFDLTDDNAAALGAICRRLDGLPLAIELAAARVRLLPPAAMVRELERLEPGATLDVLSGGAAALPARQRTQRAAIGWSYDLLPAPEQALFRRLAILAGSFSLAAARALCAGSDEEPFLDRLNSLVEKHLVRPLAVTGDEARFDLLETLRDFALDRLRADPDAGALARAHFEHFLAHARAAEPRLKSAGQSATLDALERDLPNFRAALGWAEREGEPESVVCLAVALRWFWMMRGYSSEGRRWLAVGLASDIPTALRAEALHVAGNLAQGQGDAPEAMAQFEESLRHFRTLGDKAGLAKSLGSLGLIAQDRGDYPRARALLEEGLALRRELSDTSGVGDALINLSSVAIGLSDYEQARAFSEEALLVMRQLGNEHHASACIANLGLVALYQGDVAQAEERFEESLAIRRALNDGHCSGSSLNLLGQAALLRGDPARATERFGESLTLLLRVGARHALAASLEGLAAAAVARAQWSEAARLLGAAEGLRDASGSARAPQDERLHEQTLLALRARLAAPELRAAWAIGRTTPVEQLAVATAPA